MAKSAGRFQKYDSDRSGFTGLKRSMVKQGPWLVAGDDYDAPPPATSGLGGEGDVSSDALNPTDGFTIADLATASSLDNPVNYITAAGGVTASAVHPWMFVAGSNNNITITANPAITAGVEDQVLALYCVGGSTITLTHGNGLVMAGSQRYTMTSGSIITFIYDTGGSAWLETSRTIP